MLFKKNIPLISSGQLFNKLSLKKASNIAAHTYIFRSICYKQRLFSLQSNLKYMFIGKDLLDNADVEEQNKDLKC